MPDVAALRARVDALLDDGGIPYQERLLWAGFYEGMGVDATPLDLQRLITHLEALRGETTLRGAVP